MDRRANSRNFRVHIARIDFQDHSLFKTRRTLIITLIRYCHIVLQSFCFHYNPKLICVPKLYVMIFDQ